MGSDFRETMSTLMHPFQQSVSPISGMNKLSSLISVPRKGYAQHPAIQRHSSFGTTHNGQGSYVSGAY